MSNRYEYWEEIVSQVKTGDDRGMIELYTVLKSGTRAFIRKQLREDDADDYVHELFILLVEQIRAGRLRDPQRLIGYATSIAKNMVRYRIRAVQRTREKFVDMDGMMIEDTSMPADRVCIERENREILDYGYSFLSESHKQIINRLYVLDQDKEQVMSETGITEKQFSNIKNRSTAKLIEFAKRRAEGHDMETTIRKSLKAAA